MTTKTDSTRFQIRQVDAIMYDDSWNWNTSYNLGTMTTIAKDERRAFIRWLNNKAGVSFFRGRTRITFDGDCYTVEDRKTGKPLFCAIPMC